MAQAILRKKDSSSSHSSPTSNPLTPTSDISLSHHERRCGVCRHPDRAAIEQDFVHWRSPHEIALEYKISDRASVYRHAQATGLYAIRKRNVRWVLERILEAVDETPLTGSTIVRAVRAYTRITDDGQWVEPPTRILVSHDSIVVDTNSPGRTDTDPDDSSREVPETIALLGAAVISDPELVDAPEEVAVEETSAGTLSVRK